MLNAGNKPLANRLSFHIVSFKVECIKPTTFAVYKRTSRKSTLKSTGDIALIYSIVRKTLDCHFLLLLNHDSWSANAAYGLECFHKYFILDETYVDQK